MTLSLSFSDSLSQLNTFPVTSPPNVYKSIPILGKQHDSAMTHEKRSILSKKLCLGPLSWELTFLMEFLSPQKANFGILIPQNCSTY